MRIRKKIKTRMESRKNRHVKLYDIGHSFTIIMMHPRPGKRRLRHPSLFTHAITLHPLLLQSR